MFSASTKLFLNIAAGSLRPGHPSYLVLFVTSRCNCRCPMCFNWQNVTSRHEARSELQIDEIEKIAQSMAPLPQLLLSGGEPFMRDDIPEIVHAFYKYSHTRQISIPTNGTLTSRIEKNVTAMLESCPEAYFNLNLSLDGIGKQHDVSRGLDGCFDRLTDTYRRLEKVRDNNSRLSVNFLTVIKKTNTGEITEILRYVKDNFKPNYHAVGLIRGDVCLTDEKDFCVEDAERLIEGIHGNKETFGNLPVFQRIAPAVGSLTNKLLKDMRVRKERRFNCLAGRKMVVITQDGLLMPCEPLWLEPDTRHGKRVADFVMGDLKDYGFDVEKALKSPEAKRVLKFISDRKCFCQYDCAVMNSIIYCPLMGHKLLAEIFRQ